MFDFRNGMLGVVVVAVAIGAALFASYFAGIESVEHDVVKYNELADVTGLFDTETSPQYVDYDPSSNYTGYYSEESYSTEMGKYYFAEDQVYFTPNEDSQGNTRVNNYKIDLKPTEINSGTINLTAEENQELIDRLIYWAYNSGQRSLIVNSTTLDKLIESQGWTGTEFTIICDPGSFEEGQFTLMCLKSSVMKHEGDDYAYVKNPELTGILEYRDGPYYVVTETYEASKIANPIMACKYNTVSKQAAIYYDVNMEGPYTTVDGNNIIIMWDNINPGFLTDEFTYTEIIYPPDKYLNPNHGVSLKDGA